MIPFSTHSFMEKVAELKTMIGLQSTDHENHIGMSGETQDNFGQTSLGSWSLDKPGKPAKELHNAEPCVFVFFPQLCQLKHPWYGRVPSIINGFECL